MAIGDPGDRGQIYPDFMFNRATADTALTQMNANDTSTQGPYSVLADGYLLTIKVTLTAQAATSLAQEWEIQMTSTAWKPINTITLAGGGFGLATAPQAQDYLVKEYKVNLPVFTSIKIAAKDIFYFSPVTPNLLVEGTFWAKPQ